jgi:hypothetical protein
MTPGTTSYHHISPHISKATCILGTTATATVAAATIAAAIAAAAAPHPQSQQLTIKVPGVSYQGFLTYIHTLNPSQLAQHQPTF